jgi:hypothetical protein
MVKIDKPTAIFRNLQLMYHHLPNLCLALDREVVFWIFFAN